MQSDQGISRRQVLRGGAALLVAAAGAGGLGVAVVEGRPKVGLDAFARSTLPDSLDAWLAIHTDSSVTAFFGKMDMGQGVDTAIAQIVAEELDISVDTVTVVMADTALTVNQGGASASSACRLGAVPLRNAAAEARRILFERAGERFNRSPDDLAVADGVIHVAGSPDEKISYGALITDAGFGAKMMWNGRYGNALGASAVAKPKDPANYRVVGTPVPRRDIPGKILATTEFCHHVTLPRMLHGRMIRPPVANAVPLGADEQSIADIPSARIIHKRNLLAVVAATEWEAIKAARQLTVTWSETEAPFPDMAGLYDYIRQAPPVASNGKPMTFGIKNYNTPRGYKAYDPAPTLQVLAGAARVLEADYEVPFNSHARMAPSVAVADVTTAGAVIYSDAQKSHYTQEGIAKLLGIQEQQVRVIWKPGPGSYGRSDADEAAFDAAILSRETGRPVRVQWMRHEGHAWDPKAPAAVIRMKAGFDADNAMIAWYFHAKGFSGWDVKNNASNPGDTLAGMLLGWQKWDEHNFGTPLESYEFPNQVHFWETVEAFQENASPLRCAHMRSPQKVQIAFAHECFIDEAAAAQRLDPITFRKTYIRDRREIDVLDAVAKLAHWEMRPSPARGGDGEIARGRGVALMHSYGAYVATVCEVEINRRTGRVWPRRFAVAHDCGLVINPLGLRGTIEGNIIQGASRAMWEEVQFDEQNVRSVDWESYPILDSMDVPEAIDIVTLEPPGEPPGGAGEPAHVTVAPAIANAIFDAIGIRLRRLPLTPERIREGLGL